MHRDNHTSSKLHTSLAPQAASSVLEASLQPAKFIMLRARSMQGHSGCPTHRLLEGSMLKTLAVVSLPSPIHVSGMESKSKAVLWKSRLTHGAYRSSFGALWLLRALVSAYHHQQFPVNTCIVRRHSQRTLGAAGVVSASSCILLTPNPLLGTCMAWCSAHRRCKHNACPLLKPSC